MSLLPKLKISPLPFEDKLIVDAFRANQLVTGPHIDLFEKGLADVFHFTYANTVSSGFAGLFLALKSLKLKSARVVVPAVSTCQAITNAVLANGFEVVFCAIDPNHLSLAEGALSGLFHEKAFDVIIAPSHFGIPAPIVAYKKYGVPVIEDACQAFYTRTTLQSHADIMVLSFYPTKQFNCIEGGAVLYNSQDKAEIIQDLRYYDHQTGFDGKPRYNFRMANLHAAFGCLALEKLEEERKCLIDRRDDYIVGIKHQNLLLAAQCEAAVVPWRFLIKSDDAELFEHLALAQIQTGREMVSLQGPVAIDVHSAWFNEFQSIPFYSTLKGEEQKFIIQRINEWN